MQDVILGIFEKADITRPIENLTSYVYRSLYYRVGGHANGRHPESRRAKQKRDFDWKHCRDFWRDEVKQAFDRYMEKRAKPEHDTGVGESAGLVPRDRLEPPVTVSRYAVRRRRARPVSFIKEYADAVVAQR